MTTGTMLAARAEAPPATIAVSAVCTSCHGTGWADPFDVHDGSPPLTWCGECLGAGLDGCPTCDGYGAVAEPSPCPDCDEAPVG